MADRVAVFNEGRVAQVGTPEDIYERPATRFVADFVGSSNVLAPAVTEAFGGPRAWASLRPEAIRLAPGGRVRGTVTGARYLGAGTRLEVRTGALPRTPSDHHDGRIAVLVPAGAAVPGVGAEVALDWDAGALHLMGEEP